MKRVIAALLLAALALGIVFTACAHDDQREHDRDLKYVLFGAREAALNSDEQAIFQAIADAAALAIDQFSPNNTARWKEANYNGLQSTLQRLGLPGLNVAFDSIDLNSNAAPDGKNITANSHRRYTHLGWNYRSYPNADFWKARKQVLLHTVNWTLFHDGAALAWVPWLRDVLYAPDEQCDAFCALVYYIHIAGDHIAGDTPDKLTDLEPLIQYSSMSSPGILVELNEQLRIVFASQTNSWTYAALMEALSALMVKAEQHCGAWSAVDTAERCAANQEYAQELLDILSRYFPTLLKGEPFFAKHFN